VSSSLRAVYHATSTLASSVPDALGPRERIKPPASARECKMDLRARAAVARMLRGSRHTERPGPTRNEGAADLLRRHVYGAGTAAGVGARQ